MYELGTSVVFNFREYVFEKFVKHFESYNVKLLIGFPSLICGILANQKKTVTNDDEVGIVPRVLNIS